MCRCHILHHVELSLSIAAECFVTPSLSPFTKKKRDGTELHPRNFLRISTNNKTKKLWLKSPKTNWNRSLCCTFETTSSETFGFWIQLELERVHSKQPKTKMCAISIHTPSYSWQTSEEEETHKTCKWINKKKKTKNKIKQQQRINHNAFKCNSMCLCRKLFQILQMILLIQKKNY